MPSSLLSADAANYNNYITAAFYFLPLIIRIINLHSPTIIQLEPVHSLEAVMFLYLSRAVVVSQLSSLPSPSRSQAQAVAGGGTIAILSQPRHDRDGGHLPAFISFHFAPSPVRASKSIQDEFPADDDDDTLTISDKPVIPESVISLITSINIRAGCVVGTRPVLSLLCCRSRPFFRRSLCTLVQTAEGNKLLAN